MFDTSGLCCPYCGGYSLNIIYEDLEGARIECLECGCVFDDDEG